MAAAAPLTFALRAARADELGVLVAIDDDASTLYADAGIALRFESSHPFVAAERTRFQAALQRGDVLIAAQVTSNGVASASSADEPIGFAALGELDGDAYLEQLCVVRRVMRRGVGRALLKAALERARTQRYRSVTLTTYAHLPWNRAFYERVGFRVLSPAQVTPGLEQQLDEQRRHLPLPEQRVAMGFTL